MTRKLAVFVPLGALLVALWAVKLPYYAEGPGPAKDVEPLIHVGGRQTFPTAGHFILTSVSFRDINVFGAIAAWLDPNKAVVSEHVFVPEGQTEQQANLEALTQMDQSKIDAAVVVLTRLAGYPDAHGPGVLVESVAPDCPANGELYPGDVLRSLDGRAIRSVEQFQVLLHAIPPGRPVTLRGTADGRSFTATVRRRPCDGQKRPLIGITPIATFPFDVTISSGDIGGPSAGLMWALGLYDLLTAGDLAGGRTVAGTGQIEPDGTVDPIGGVQDKIAAAKAVGATVFLVPVGNLADARKVAGDLPLVPVRTFGQALAWLLAHGGQAQTR